MRRVFLLRAETDSASVEVTNTPGWVVSEFIASRYKRQRPVPRTYVLRDSGSDVVAIENFECEDLKCR